MNKLIITSSIIVILSGCVNTSAPLYGNLVSVDAELSSVKWQSLTRVPPLFPIEEARENKEGCAEIEYVITPDYQIKDVVVVRATSKHFAKQAQHSLAKWQWHQLPKALLSEPLKTTTRFEFCLETGDGHCEQHRPLNNSQCAGNDVLMSVATKTRHRV